MNTKTRKKILFTKITMIISVILLAITIPIDICMGNYLHAFTTCLWIYISISTYKMANLLSDAIHVILRHNNHIIKLKGLIVQIKTILEESIRQIGTDKSVEEGMSEDINKVFVENGHYTD